MPPVPVLATHIACRFGKYKYNLSDATIGSIGARNGVMGVIFCDHWMSDGRPRNEERTVARTFLIIKANIERIKGIIDPIRKPTESPHKCTAIGSDLDGFIKPMLSGLDNMGCMRDLERWLTIEYGEDTARLILKCNALRVLESGWRDAELLQAVRLTDQLEAARTQTTT